MEHEDAMALSIASIMPADLNDIIAMAHELSLHEGDLPPDLTVDGLAEVMFSTHPLLFGRFARIGEAPAGYALWTVGYTMQHGKRLLDMVDLYVRPDFRRKGVARALLRAVASVAQDCDYRFLTVKTFDGNAEANAFYPACGGRLDQVNVYDFGLRAMASLLNNSRENVDR